MVVLDALPQHLDVQTLTVMHVAFAWIISQDAIDHDLLFALIEPPVFAAEGVPSLTRSLCRAWRQVEPRCDTDAARQHPL
jgi:hypothetical protein